MTIDLRHQDCRAGLAEIPSQSVDVIFADPPYYTGKRAAQAATYTISAQLARQDWVDFHADWDAQWESLDEYQVWCATWIGECQRVLKPNGSIWICGTNHNIPAVGMVLAEQGWYTNRWISWFKPNAFPNRRLDKMIAATEIVIWARPTKKTTSRYNATIAKQYGGGKNLRDMWPIPFDSARARRLKQLGFIHPSKKPPALVERCLRLTAPETDAMIVDPFAGSGTTGEVVLRYRQQGWRGILFETDPTYIAGMQQLFRLAPQRSPDTREERTLFDYDYQ